MKTTEWVKLLLPLVSGFAVGGLCPMKDSGANIPARPPSWVFGAVWPVLYLIIGYAWVTMSKSKSKIIDPLFGAITVFLTLWVWMYSCAKKKRLALYVLVILIGLGIAAIKLCKDEIICIGLSLYVAWLLFAMQLNYTIVNKKNN
jgi:tryptophan-rich sensory protein